MYIISGVRTWNFGMKGRGILRTQDTIVSICNFNEQFLPPAYVVRREGYVLTRVCPSICLSTGGGQSSVQPGGVRSSWGGGSGPARGVRSSWGGSGPAGGGGQVQPVGGSGPASGGVRSSRWGWSSQPGGVSQDRTTEWVVTTWVCLLHSHRRTFLLHLNW